MFEQTDYDAGPMTDPTTTQPQQPRRFNTTPNWMDPYNPPQPQDPYYAEWAAANPGIPESSQPAVGTQLNANGNTPYTPAPATQTGGGGGGGGGGYSLGGPPPVRTVFDGPGSGGGAPTYSGPSFTPPGYTPPPAFSYKDFAAPSAADALNDPGYQFRYQQGLGSIVNNKAAQGTLGTGGALKDFIDYGQQSGSQEYQNVWGRARDAYTMNRANALDAYNVNYNTQYKDPYQIADKGALDTFSGAQHNADQSQYYQTHAYDQNRMYDWNSFLENYNQWRNNRLDDFDMKFRTITA